MGASVDDPKDPSGEAGRVAQPGRAEDVDGRYELDGGLQSD